MMKDEQMRVLFMHQNSHFHTVLFCHTSDNSTALVVNNSKPLNPKPLRGTGNPFFTTQPAQKVIIRQYNCMTKTLNIQ